MKDKEEGRRKREEGYKMLLQKGLIADSGLAVR